MITPEEYNTLKEQVDTLERERQEAVGAKKQILSTLRKEFKVKSVESAKKLLEKLMKEKCANEKSFEIAYKKFRLEFKKYKKRVKQ